ncbi:MAG: alkaline phosphatase [Candidatus Krumholzibacteriota bacterium]|nr:alkaline phosphatase [Candidatus Krumholzibacteriota bacterium]
MRGREVERRRVVTDEPMQVDPSLLGRALASPWRRGAAIAVDFAIAFVVLVAVAAVISGARHPALRRAAIAGVTGGRAAADSAGFHLELLRVVGEASPEAVPPEIRGAVEEGDAAAVNRWVQENDVSVVIEMVTGRPSVFDTEQRMFRIRSDVLFGSFGPFLSGFTAFIVYFTVLSWAFRGRTPGKALFGMQVARLDGRPLRFMDAFGRAAGYAASASSLSLGFLEAFWHPNRQAVHDRIAGTVVLRVRRGAAAALILLLLAAGSPAAAAAGDAPAIPRNIIFLIGDGMGAGAVTAAWTAHGPLNLGRLSVGGLMTTDAHGNLVTDSAAGGTALATGVKTVVGAVSISPAGDTLETLMEAAESRGMATGVVVTCAVTHATPAVFLAHALSRRDYEGIAAQIAAGGVDVLIGGGRDFFLPEAAGGCRRGDRRDLLALLGRRMPVLSRVEDLDPAGTGPVTCLYAPAHPPVAADRPASLAVLTGAALARLSRMGNGFVLMVEGSQIDWEAHENYTGGIVAETLDFDGAVGVALDFAARDGSTLVVVTADHETGGFAVHGLEPATGSTPIGGFTTGDHTATMVPIFAEGPGCGRFSGIRDNAEIGRILLELVCFRP